MLEFLQFWGEAHSYHSINSHFPSFWTLFTRAGSLGVFHKQRTQPHSLRSPGPVSGAESFGYIRPHSSRQPVSVPCPSPCLPLSHHSGKSSWMVKVFSFVLGISPFLEQCLVRSRRSGNAPWAHESKGIKGHRQRRGRPGGHTWGRSNHSGSVGSHQGLP